MAHSQTATGSFEEIMGKVDRVQQIVIDYQTALRNILAEFEYIDISELSRAEKTVIRIARTALKITTFKTI